MLLKNYLRSLRADSLRIANFPTLDGNFAIVLEISRSVCAYYTASAVSTVSYLECAEQRQSMQGGSP